MLRPPVLGPLDAAPGPFALNALTELSAAAELLLHAPIVLPAEAWGLVATVVAETEAPASPTACPLPARRGILLAAPAGRTMLSTGGRVPL
jgi:hypothetical protein